MILGFCYKYPLPLHLTLIRHKSSSSSFFIISVAQDERLQQCRIPTEVDILVVGKREEAEAVGCDHHPGILFTQKRVHKVSVQQAVPFNLGYTFRFGLQVYKSYRAV